MRSDRAVGVRGILTAAAIVLGCLWVAWLAIRTTAVAVLPAVQPGLATIAPNDPDRVLNAALIQFVLKRGQLDDADYAAVANAARAAPLDSRPYMFAATKHLMRHDGQPMIPLLEAGRRLDPRQRWIRLYLLDRYLRAKRYDEAMTEFAVLSRLVGDASGPIVAELVRMSTDPATSGAVHQMFLRNPALESNVLAELAKSGASPAQILAIASPAARAAAGQPGGWGAVMVTTMADKHQYAQALAVWRMIYRVPSTAAVPYDGDFKGLPGSDPFNWVLAASDVGAADRTDGGLTINYYGRQIGKLAEQLLMLAPGQYRLVFALSGPPPANGGPTLSWNVACDQHETPLVLDGAVPAASERARTVAMTFTVPAQNCPAQWLRLTGSPGQGPGTVTATIQHVAIQPVQAKP